MLSVRAAKNLQHFGCDRGRKIFIRVDEVSEIVPIIFGAICLGCAVVPIIENASQAECEYFLNITKPEFAFCHLKSHRMLRDCFTNLKINAKIFTVDGQADDSISIQSLFDSVDDETNFE